MTNADKIRQMTDEEIANAILRLDDNRLICEHCSKRYVICDNRKQCREHIIEWLKQEVDDAEAKP